MDVNNEQYTGTGLLQPEAEYYYTQYVTEQVYPALPMAATTQPWGDDYASHDVPDLPTDRLIASPAFSNGFSDYNTAFTTPSFCGLAHAPILDNVASSDTRSVGTPQWASEALSPSTVRSQDILSPRTDSSYGLQYEQQPIVQPAAAKSISSGAPAEPSRTRHQRQKTDRQKAAATQSKSTKTKRKMPPSEPPPKAKKEPKEQKAPAKTKPKKGKSKQLPSLLITASLMTTVTASSDTASDYDSDGSEHASQHHPGMASSSRRPTQRERNRMAATKCRTKTKATTSELQAHERRMSQTHGALVAQEAALQSEVLALRSMVLEHHSCGCVATQRYIRNAAQVIADSGGKTQVWGPEGRGGLWPVDDMGGEEEGDEEEEEEEIEDKG